MSSDTEKSEHGKRVIAGRLLSRYIREIANELHDDPVIKARGEDAAILTKAEAVARYIWKLALGYEETEDVFDKSGKKIGIKPVRHKPDKWAITVIWDRMEGRAGAADVKSDDSKASLADRISDQGRKRLSQIAKSSLTSE